MRSLQSARAQSSSGGFSLIELLVVIFIIGLMIGTVSLSVNIGSEPEDQLEEEAQRLLELSRLAGDRAVLTGEPIGLLINPPLSTLERGATLDEGLPSWGYEWQRYRGGQWVAAEAPLGPRQLPESIELSLEVEGAEINFSRANRFSSANSSSANNEDDPPPLPSIVFYPGGEVTPFLLTLFDAEAIDEQRLLTSKRTGRVEIIEADQLHSLSRGVIERDLTK